VDPLDWQAGRLLITDIGPQKLKVVHVLRKTLNLPLADALRFVASHRFVSVRIFACACARWSENYWPLAQPLPLRLPARCWKPCG
jgi:hypothetical protein